MKAATARVPGKMILFGEYAVLHGGLAVVAAVDRYATCVVIPADHVQITGVGLGSVDLRAPDDGRLPFARRLLATHPAPQGHYTIDTRAFGDAEAPGGWTKLGLGSSAASTVALARAADPSADPWQIYRRAQGAHRAVQGTGSGADIAASAFGGVLAYRWAEATETGQIEPLVVAENCAGTIYTAWTDRAASTPQLVHAVGAWAQRHRAAHDALMATIAEAAEAAAVALRGGDRAGVTAAVLATHAALQQLTDAAGVPIVTEAHHRLAAAIAPSGAQCKPMGAGGGDLALIWATDATTLPSAARAAQAAGFRVHRFEIAPNA